MPFALARSRPAHELALPGRPAGRRRRDDRLVRLARPPAGSTATSSASADRACWGRDDGRDARARTSSPGILPLLRARRAAADPGRLAAAVRRRAAAARSPTLRAELERGVACEPDRGRRLRRGLRLRACATPAADLPARARLPAAHGADGRRLASRSAPVGLVHVDNRIAQHRPIGVGEELTLRRPRDRARSRTRKGAPSRSSPRCASAARSSGRSTARCCAAAAASARARRERSGEALAERVARGRSPASAEWRLAGDLGRRYAAVSGDRNPIHMHALAAKPLGFPRAIAHGMWTKARCLAALERRLPDAFAVEVRFRRPILLPGRGRVRMRVTASSSLRGPQRRSAAPSRRPVAARRRAGRRPTSESAQ